MKYCGKKKTQLIKVTIYNTLSIFNTLKSKERLRNKYVGLINLLYSSENYKLLITVYSQANCLKKKNHPLKSMGNILFLFY